MFEKSCSRAGVRFHKLCRAFPGRLPRPVVREKVLERPVKLRGVFDDESPPAFHKHDRFMRVPVAWTEKDGDAEHGGLENVVNPLPEASADKRDMGERVEDEEDSHAVDDDDVLPRVFVQT